MRGRGIQADGDIRGSQGAQVGNIPWSPGTHLNDPEAMRVGQPRERHRDSQFVILVTGRRVHRPQRPQGSSEKVFRCGFAGTAGNSDDVATKSLALEESKSPGGRRNVGNHQLRRYALQFSLSEQCRCTCVEGFNRIIMPINLGSLDSRKQVTLAHMPTVQCQLAQRNRRADKLTPGLFC